MENQLVIEPLVVLDVQRHNDPNLTKVLVQWQGLYPENSSWELLSELPKEFPDIVLEGKVYSQLEGDVTDQGSSVHVAKLELEPEVLPQTRARRNRIRPKWMKDYEIP